MELMLHFAFDWEKPMLPQHGKCVWSFLVTRVESKHSFALLTMTHETTVLMGLLYDRILQHAGADTNALLQFPMSSFVSGSLIIAPAYNRARTLIITLHDSRRRAPDMLGSHVISRIPGDRLLHFQHIQNDPECMKALKAGLKSELKNFDVEWVAWEVETTCEACCRICPRHQEKGR